MGTVVELKPKLYEAKLFGASTLAGDFHAAGTLCGCIDFVGPFRGTYTLSPTEVESLISMLQKARKDVLENSDSYGDPRLVD